MNNLLLALIGCGISRGMKGAILGSLLLAAHNLLILASG